MPLTTSNINILQPRDIGRLLLWRARHHHRSVLSHDRYNSRTSSSNESLITGEQSDGRWSNPDTEKVPRGFFPVYVGPNQRRFIIPMKYLAMPDFRKLMEGAAEEFGFEQKGGLKIPCEEDDFEEVMFKCFAKYSTRPKKTFSFDFARISRQRTL